MKVEILNLDGQVVDYLDLPELRYIRSDLIRRAVLSEESYIYQPKGNYRWAGMDTSARFVGREGIYGSLKDQGQARLPRELLGGGRYGRVRIVPQSVKGRRAHPPKPEKILIEKINNKEKKLAMLNAIIGAKLFVVRDLDSVSKVKDGKRVIENLIGKIDVDRKRITGVRRKRKTRAYKVLVRVTVVTENNTKGFNNIPGVRCKTVKNLMVRDIAPGGEIKNRKLVISENAMRELLSKLIDI